MEFTITKDTRKVDGWVQGMANSYIFQAKVFNDCSEEFGLDCGRISKLWIKDTESKRTICNYDRGWDIGPATAEEREIVKFIVTKLENLKEA